MWLQIEAVKGGCQTTPVHCSRLFDDQRPEGYVCVEFRVESSSIPLRGLGSRPTSPLCGASRKALSIRWMKNLPGRTMWLTCDNLPISDRTSDSCAVERSAGHRSKRSLSCSSLSRGKEIVITSVSISHPSTISRVSHDDTFLGDSRGGPLCSCLIVESDQMPAIPRLLAISDGRGAIVSLH